MPMLKSDFHMHSVEDWHDWHHVKHSARQLIDRLASQNFDVVSITHHNHVHFNKALFNYAKKKGILLIPGAEIKLEGADVLLVNVTNNDLKKLKKLDDLKKIRDKALIVAPHPFFKFGSCIGNRIFQHMHNFHAIEYCHYYTRIMNWKPFTFFNGNIKAELVASLHKKALVGTSDTHRLYEVGSSFTWVDSEKNVKSWIEAVKRRKVRLDTRPMKFSVFFMRVISSITKEKIRPKIKRIKPQPDLPEDPFFRKVHLPKLYSAELK